MTVRSSGQSQAEQGNTTFLQLLDVAAPGGVSQRRSDRLAKAHDASHYLLVPDAVVTATSAGDIAEIVRVCSLWRRPLTFRSGGTSLSGQAVSDGVLVDARKHFRGVTVLDDGARVVVQPGTTIRAVNARLAPHGTRLGPDPASEVACTVGGVVANNSSGMSCGTERNTYSTLESMLLVLASGTTIDTGAPDADDRLAKLEPEIHRGLRTLRDRVRADPESVRTIRTMFAMKNTMGYNVNAFLDFDRPVDILAHVVIGSEGTLAFVAEATFRTVPIRPQAATGLLLFENLYDATRSLPGLVGSGFDTIELLDATSLRVCQRSDAARSTVLHGLEVTTHAGVLVEHQAVDAGSLVDRVADSLAVLCHLPLAQEPGLSSDPRQRGTLWSLRKGLYASVAGNRPAGTTALLEDVAVPVERLADVCRSLTTMFARHGYDDSVIFGHAKDGNIHFMLNERFDQPALIDRYRVFTEEMVDLVLGAGGTLKAEHGTGRIMAPFVRRQYGDELYDVMVLLKRLLDPADILNPGVVISSDAESHLKDFKTSAPVEAEVDRCVECGFCESVCPSRDITTTPRTRIVLRREMARARQQGDARLVAELEADYDHDAIDTCAVDGMCQTVCPVLIDTGSLVARLREGRHSAAEQRVWRRAASHWSATTRLAAVALDAADALPNGLARFASEAGRRALGEETVPAWTPDLPRGGKPRSAMVGESGHPVVGVFFPACLGALFAPQDGAGGAARALIRLSDRAGLGLRVPEGIDSLCCSTPWKSKGLSSGYGAMSERVLPALWDATEGGRLPVICDASSCSEGLVRLFAKQERSSRLKVIDAVTYAAEQLVPRLPAPSRVGSAVLHPTCSMTRLQGTDALRVLAAMVAEDVVVPYDWGCCAFAGDRGMLHPELTASATRAEAREVNERDYDLYLSANRTCEIGLARATGKPYQHVLEALERAISTANTPPGMH